MIGKYIKTSDGRGVILRDSTVIRQIREKEELQEQIQSLQTKIDKLEQRLIHLEQHHKD